MIQSVSQSDKPVRRAFVNRKKRQVTKMADEKNGTAVAEASENPALDAAITKAEETNKTRTGKGTRVRVGQTRGRNPQVISWEAFDEKLPESLPTSLTEFMEITKTASDKEGEKLVVQYLIDGYNDSQYSQASDPIAEFVNPSWPDDVQKQFRLVVRNYSNATGVSLEDAVALIKPGIEKSQTKA